MSNSSRSVRTRCGRSRGAERLDHVRGEHAVGAGHENAGLGEVHQAKANRASRLGRGKGGPVEYRELTVPGAWEITTQHFGDDRGLFLEVFKDAPFAEAVGHDFTLAQVNCSVSAAGVLRGIHFADVPPGQAKYVTCAKGAVLDVVVDIRVGLAHVRPVGLGAAGRCRTAAASTCPRALATRSCRSKTARPSCTCAPRRTRPDASTRCTRSTRHRHRLAQRRPRWRPARRRNLSPKDEAAPTLAEARDAGLLPTADAVAPTSPRCAGGLPLA